jgi:Domain of Unknown Function (DUF1080)
MVADGKGCREKEAVTWENEKELSMAKTAAVVSLLLSAGLLVGNYAQAVAQEGGPKIKGAWTDLDDKTLPADFQLQGEYVGQFTNGGKLGAQVISLGKSSFQAVLLVGGLPGDGWDGQTKMLLDGKRDGAVASFLPVKGKRRYNATKAEEFMATSKFPPPGHADCTATIMDGMLRGNTEDGKGFQLKKTIRTSPTMGLKSPSGALVLFDGTSTDELKGGRLDKVHGILHTDGKDVSTKRKLRDFALHVEFMVAYRPDFRGQQRGNSGVYLVNQYEVQILDSFGLEGKKNECGSIYEQAAPRVHMCLPPLQWQTYDIDFTNAIQDGEGKKLKNARVTVRHNAVVIHDDVEIAGKTGINSRNEPEGTPGILLLQGHGNPTQFRNVWVVQRER